MSFIENRIVHIEIELDRSCSIFYLFSDWELTKNYGMSLKVTGVYFSASSAGAGPGKMKATIRASRLNGGAASATSTTETNVNNIVNSPLVCNKTASVVASHSQSLDYLHMNFEEKRQIIASSLSLVDFLHPPKVKGKNVVPLTRPVSLC